MTAPWSWPLSCRSIGHLAAVAASLAAAGGAAEGGPAPREAGLFLPWITYGGQCDVDHAMAVMSLLLRLQREGVSAQLYPIQGESLIPRARNIAAALFLNTSLSHMLFVDADIVFEAEDVLRMLRLGNDVIAGAYRLKSEELGWAFDGPYASTEVPGIYRASLLSTGFMLITRRALETIAQAQPGRVYRNNIPSHGVVDAYDYFPIGVNKHGMYLSEDFGFSELCAASGIELFLYGNATLQHIGKRSFVGNLHEVTIAAAQRPLSSGASYGLAAEQTRLAAATMPP